MTKIIKLSKHQVDIDGNQEHGQITINNDNGKIVPDKTFGVYGNTLCSEDIYDYNNHSFIESLSPENLDFFVQAKSTIDYKQKLLKCIDYFFKECCIITFAEYATKLNNHIKRKFKHEFDVEQLRGDIEFDSIYGEVDPDGYVWKCYVDKNKSKKLTSYEKKVGYEYWKPWIEDESTAEIFQPNNYNGNWENRIELVSTLREQYYTSDYAWSNKELANKVDILLNDPNRWAMFENPEQTRAEIQAYAIKLKKYRELLQQLARELYF